MGKIIFLEDFSNYKYDTIDESKWNFEIGGHGFGNQELQYYTNRKKNCFIEDGILHIKAYKEEYMGNHYTSCKIFTYKKFSFMYGRVDITCKIPKQKGTWPALWLLPNSFKEGNIWPICGEMDIMEHVGTEKGVFHFSLHSKNQNFKNNNQRVFYIKNELLLDDFHTFSMEWKKDEIIYYIDNEYIGKFTKDKSFTKYDWPYDEPQYLIINLAIGGCWPKDPDKDFISDEFLIKKIQITKEVKEKI